MVDFFVTVDRVGLYRIRPADSADPPLLKAQPRMIDWSFWHLSGSPFADRRGGHFFPGGDHEEALSRLLFAAEQSRSCGIIYGPAGVGKSRVLQEVRRQLPGRVRACYQGDLTGVSTEEFAGRLGRWIGANLTGGRRWERLEDWSRGQARLGRQQVWLFDEVDSARESLETELLRLMRLNEATRASATMLLAVGHPGLIEQLVERAEFVVELSPWDPEDSQAFVVAALRRVGGNEDLLTSEGWDALIDACAGLPLRLQQLTEVALVAGSVLRASRLEGELVTAVAQQLGWAETPRSPLTTVDF